MRDRWSAGSRCPMTTKSDFTEEEWAQVLRAPLLADVALEVQAMSQQHTHPLKGYKPDREGDPRAALVDELRSTRGLVESKATPEEATAFGAWMVDVAQAAADAAKEGGFMGIGATRVSEREQAMLDRVREALTG